MSRPCFYNYTDLKLHYIFGHFNGFFKEWNGLLKKLLLLFHISSILSFYAMWSIILYTFRFLGVFVGANRKLIWIFFYIIFIDKKFTPEWNAFFNEESSRTWKCPYCAKNQKVMLRTFHSNNNNFWRTLLRGESKKRKRDNRIIKHIILPRT